MNRQLSMEFVRITEQAALRSGRLMGVGDKEGADQAAVDGMHEQFAKTPVSGTVVIGEGEIDEAPMLYIGEHVGAGGEEVDIAVDPVEGTNLVAKGQNGAIAVLAIAPKGCLLHAPDMYMQKICVGPRAKGRIDINASVTENLKNVADAMDREISDLTVVILDRERHEKIIREAREAGARIRLITDGDVVPSIDCGIQGSGIHMVLGSGGAPEGVLSAVGLKCLGGDMQAKLLPHTDEELRRLHAMGIDDPNKVLTLDDLVKGDDCIFSETATTDCAMLRGVRYFGGGARTSTLVLRYKTGTVRFVDTITVSATPSRPSVSGNQEIKNSPFRAVFLLWTRTAGVRVQRVQKVLKVQRVLVGALQKEGAPVCIKPLQPGFARGKTCQPPFGRGKAAPFGGCATTFATV